MFHYSNKIQSMLVDYAVTEMGCFDDYLYDALCSKTMRGNGINSFLLQVAQCITLHQKQFVTEIRFAEALLKSLYSRLGFKVIKDLETPPNFEVAPNNIITSQENPKHCRNKQLAYNVI